MRLKNKPSLSNIKIAIIFFALVFTIILISLIAKSISIVSRSLFDNTNRFTISVSSNKNREVISFSPKAQSISVLHLDKDSKNLKIASTLAIPIDAKVENLSDINGNNISSLMFNLFLNYKDIKTNLTIFDILRLYLFARTVPPNYVYVKHISLSLDSSKIDKIVSQLFSDEVIEKENANVEIINATNVAGLGNRLGRIVTNIGGNVVIVSTENKEEALSTVSYSGRKSYTVEKLSKILGFKVVKVNKKSIADIVIVIGKDSLPTLSF